jgi:hypothetical protein
LQDLLNPASLDDKEPSFFINDFYNAASLDDDEDEDDEPPFITYASDVQTLEISDNLVDLANSELIAQYLASLETASSHWPAMVVQPSSNVPTTPWTEDNWAARDADF